MRTSKFNPSVLFFIVGLCILPCIGIAKSGRDKVKGTIDQVADGLKKGADKCGDKLDALQKYAENYDWKGLIQGEANSGAVTLSDLRLNGHHRVVVVHPGDSIDGDVVCFLNPDKVTLSQIYK